MSNFPDLLTRDEAAIALRVHVSSIDRLVKDGKLRASKWGSTVRIPTAAVAAFLAASETTEPAISRTRRASRAAA